MITINENVTLTKNQHQALKIVCDIYEQSFSEYIQEALVQTMKSDIKDGNLSINLLERLDAGDSRLPEALQEYTSRYRVLHRVLRALISSDSFSTFLPDLSVILVVAAFVVVDVALSIM